MMHPTKTDTALLKIVYIYIYMYIYEKYRERGLFTFLFYVFIHLILFLFAFFQFTQFSQFFVSQFLTSGMGSWRIVRNGERKKRATCSTNFPGLPPSFRGAPPGYLELEEKNPRDTP